VDVLNKHAESPLHLAIRMMHPDIVQLLVNYGNSNIIHYVFRLVLPTVLHCSCKIKLESTGYSALPSPPRLMRRAVDT